MKFRLLAAIFTIPALSSGQVTIQDAPPVDAAQLLTALKAIREQNEAGIKARKQAAYNQVMQAAASGTSAAAFWKEAVKEVQFAGADHSASKISDWKDGDGDALNSKECQNAARLHLYWLGLSLQHSMGTETKTMLQNIIEFTKQIRATEEVIDRVDAAIDRAKGRNDRDKTADEQTVKRVHDQILRTSVAGSPVARWLRLGELLNDSAKPRRAQRTEGRAEDEKPSGNGGWEMTPGNVDGIYNAIILPEFRATKDPRLMDYWELRIKQETEKAAEKKLDVEQRDWLQIRRPNLLWSRTQDMIILGQKNRAITEMFNLLKANPQHPSATAWISAIENALVPTFQAPAAPEAAPSGVVPPPVAVPAATAPATPAVDPFRLNPTKTPAQ